MDGARKCTDKIRIQSEIAKFIARNHLKVIRSCVKNFHDSYRQSENIEGILIPIIIAFELDCNDFRSPLLFDFLCNEPNQFQRITKDIVYGEVNDYLGVLTKTPAITVNYQQLHLFFRVHKFPLDSIYYFDPSQNLLRTGLSSFNCILAGFVVNQKYM